MARKRAIPRKVIAPVLPKIKGKPYKIIEIWRSVQHPDGPPLVIVEAKKQREE